LISECEMNLLSDIVSLMQDFQHPKNFGKELLFPGDHTGYEFILTFHVLNDQEPCHDRMNVKTKDYRNMMRRVSVLLSK